MNMLEVIIRRNKNRQIIDTKQKLKLKYLKLTYITFLPKQITPIVKLYPQCVQGINDENTECPLWSQPLTKWIARKRNKRERDKVTGTGVGVVDDGCLVLLTNATRRECGQFV